MKKFICIFSVFLILMGCAPQNDPSHTRVLRVGLFENLENANLFIKTHPNIQVEVVDLSEVVNSPLRDTTEKIAKLKQVLKEKAPIDVLELSTSLYEKTVDANLLKPLSSLTQQNNFSLHIYADSILETLKDMGNGEIYGLPTSYTAPYLIYNKKIFREKNVPFPKDGMTWNEIFELASRTRQTTGDKQHYGLFSDIFMDGDLIVPYLMGIPLYVVNKKKKEVTIDTPEWGKAIDLFVKYANEKAFQNKLYKIDFSEQLVSDQLKSSSASVQLTHCAMALGCYTSFIEDLTYDESNVAIPANEKHEWDIVSYPVHSKNQDQVSHVRLSNIFCIPQSASNVTDAWNFLEFMASEKTDMIVNKDFPLTKAGIVKWKQESGKNVEAMYRYKKFRYDDFPTNCEDIIDTMENIIDGKLETKEALRILDLKIKEAIEKNKS